MTCGESEGNHGKNQKLKGIDIEKCQQDNVKELTGLGSNGMWRELEDRVAWRKRVSRVASVDNKI